MDRVRRDGWMEREILGLEVNKRGMHKERILESTKPFDNESVGGENA